MIESYFPSIALHAILCDLVTAPPGGTGLSFTYVKPSAAWPTVAVQNRFLQPAGYADQRPQPRKLDGLPLCQVHAALIA
jgi:hypothetical protein